MSVLSGSACWRRSRWAWPWPRCTSRAPAAGAPTSVRLSRAAESAVALAVRRSGGTPTGARAGRRTAVRLHRWRAGHPQPSAGPRSTWWPRRTCARAGARRRATMPPPRPPRARGRGAPEPAVAAVRAPAAGRARRRGRRRVPVLSGRMGGRRSGRRRWRCATVDAPPGMPGHGVLLVRGAAFGGGGALAEVEALVAQPCRSIGGAVRGHSRAVLGHGGRRRSLTALTAGA